MVVVMLQCCCANNDQSNCKPLVFLQIIHLLKGVAVWLEGTENAAGVVTDRYLTRAPSTKLLKFSSSEVGNVSKNMLICRFVIGLFLLTS